MCSKEFGDIIKTLREEKGLTRDELAKRMNITYSALSKYETNNRFPDKETLNRIADYFGVTTDYLLGRTDDKAPRKKEIKNATTIAAHRLGDVEQLPDDAIDEINNYIDLMRLKYLKDKK